MQVGVPGAAVAVGEAGGNDTFDVELGHSLAPMRVNAMLFSI